MSKQLKDMLTESLRSRYAGVDEACLVDVTGLDVAETQTVRRRLTSKNYRLMVVKNSMARRAFSGGPLAPLSEAMTGPCALVTGGDSIIDVAKEMASLAKEFAKISLKYGLLSGEAEVIPLDEMAKFKSRDELLGDVAGLVSSPGRSIAGCLGGAGGRIAGCLKAIVDRG